MTSIELPIIGCGSQPKETDGVDLAFMSLPNSMMTYSTPHLSMLMPEQTRALLQEVLLALQHLKLHSVFDVSVLSNEATQALNELLGDGEVSIIHQLAELETHIQESVLAGVWRVQRFNTAQQLVADYLEVADIPELLKQQTFSHAAAQVNVDMSNLPDGLMNALPLLAEINAQIANDAAHVINLSLLPQTEQDLAFLDTRLGRGTVSILSRGYGTNRITSTAINKVWWVQYFNSDDTLILNTLEISSIPSVACAALEDLSDSALRLADILAV